MSKNQFPWQDTLAQRVTENLIDIKGDGVYVYDNVICGLDYDNAQEFLEDVKNSCGRHDPDKPYSLYSPDLPELRKTFLPALGELLSIDNVYSATLWDCTVEPIAEVGEVFWIAQVKPHVATKTMQLTPLSDAVTKLYNETMQAFEHVLRNEKRAGQNYTTELRGALNRVLQNTKDRCNTSPEDARRFCRAIVTLLTRDSVEVPRQQGSPELSEALERVVNLLSPEGEKEKQHCGSGTSCVYLDSTCKCDCVLCDVSTERSPMTGHEQGYQPRGSTRPRLFW